MAMQAELAPLHYEEATSWFLEHIASAAELDAMFDAANAEIQAFLAARIQTQPGNDLRFSMLGLLTRLLLSILVDADRWDSACFNYGQDPFAAPSAPDWNALFSTFEAFRRTHLNGKSGINRIPRRNFGYLSGGGISRTRHRHTLRADRRRQNIRQSALRLCAMPQSTANGAFSISFPTTRSSTRTRRTSAPP